MAFPGHHADQHVLAGYDHTITTITKTPTADPFMTAAHGKYYLTWTAGNRVEIWCSDSITDFRDRFTRHVICPRFRALPLKVARTAPPNTPHSGDIWAPELHALDGRWWVYFAADNPKIGNASHRVFVLGGPPAHTDPCASAAHWDFMGPLRGLPNGPAEKGQWAIDLTVIHLNGDMFVVYSGWPWNYDKNWWVFRNDDTQQLWIAHLVNPMTVDSPPVMISKPDRPWEFSRSGINEGPQWLQSPDGQWTGLVYSCAGSWTNQYKMATLRYLGGDPLNPTSWRKSNKPLIQSARGRGPYGPGHGNFVLLDNEVLGIFHATDKPDDGWKGRKARCQKVMFGPDGEPYMGECVGHAKGESVGQAPDGRQGKPEVVSKGGLRGLLGQVKNRLQRQEL